MSIAAFACGGPPEPSDWTPRQIRERWSVDPSVVPPRPAALSAHSWLDDVSHYRQSGKSARRGDSGSFGVGNGAVVGLIGLDAPWNTLTGLIGPGYARRSGFFGNTSLRLARDGRTLPVDEEHTMRPRGTTVVRTSLQSGGVSLQTVDVAPPGLHLVARHLTVTGAGDGDVAVQIDLSRAPNDPAIEAPQALLQRRGERHLRVHCPGANVLTAGHRLSIQLPAADPYSVLCLWELTTDGSPLQALPTFDAMLVSSRAETTALLDEAVSLDVPDPKVRDLYEGLLIMLHVQTATVGLVSPMHRYTGGWLRDAEGPVRLFLAAGLFDRARRQLDLGYQASVLRHAIANSFSLDLDHSTFEPPADPATFWAEARFMPGREPAEAPSYPVFLHALYADHDTGASLLDDDRLAFLEACIRRQPLSAEGLLPFSGDETYRFTLLSALGGDAPDAIGWSTASSFWYVSAARRLVAMGGDPELTKRADRAAEAVISRGLVADGYYAPLIRFDDGRGAPVPFEDVALAPTWTEFFSPDDPRAADAIDAAVEALMARDGTFHNPDASLGYTGMVPGFALHALSRVEHPRVEEAFFALDRIATPSGHFDETHTPDHAVLQLVHDPAGLGTAISARYRPWEGGDVGAALLEYLVGARPAASQHRLQLAPHLPAGWPRMVVDRLRMSGGRWQLTVEGFDEGRRWRLTRVRDAEPDPRDWQVDLRLNGGPYSSIWVNGIAATPEGDWLRGISLPPDGSADVIAER